jgi:hypothetical protein
MLDACRAWLGRRNGKVDLASYTSDRRDEWFAALEASRPDIRRPLDADLFARNQVPGKLQDNLDERTLWAVCTANVNLCEAWGVERGLELAEFSEDPLDAAYNAILVEERYHTRMLGEAVRALGLRMERYLPPLSDRFIVRGILHFPRIISDAVTFMSEIAGVAAFRLLHRKGRELFGDEPEALEQIDTIYDEIILDEIGHVRFLQARISRPILALCRVLTPLVAATYLAGLPEVVKLFGKTTIKKEISAVMGGGALTTVDGAQHPLNEAAAALDVGAGGLVVG